jgi:hypothetical protein
MSEEISIIMQVCSRSNTQQLLSGSSHLDPNKSSEELVNWISTISFNEEHRQAFDQHTQGTGTWILESPEFQQWVANEFRVLWCPGNRQLYSRCYPESRVTQIDHSWCREDYPSV